MTKVTVDLGDWGVGTWARAIDRVVEVTEDGVRVSLRIAKEEIIKDIIREALEAFFNNDEEIHLQINNDGVTVHAPELNHPVTVPWYRVAVTPDGLAKAKKGV